MRRLRFPLVGLLGGLFFSGCATSMLEQRVVDSFSDAIKEDNEAALRNSTSARFEEKALRSDTAFRDLEILNLPDGKLSVVETEKIDNKTRMVVVKEEDGTKYQFKLVRDAEKRRWVVDDVVFRQQKKGTRTAKSTTEVMDLLLTLREFLDTWENGNRDEILQVVSNDLRNELQELPEPWLHQIIHRVTSEYNSEMARRPEAQLNEKDAVVKLPAKHGFILMRIVQEDEAWKVADVEVHNKRVEDHPGSIRRQVVAMNSVCRFLDAYGHQEVEGLRTASSPEFFEGSLQFADLAMIKLPEATTAPDDFEIRSFAGQLTIMIPDDKNIFRFDLKETEKSVTAVAVAEVPESEDTESEVDSDLLAEASADSEKSGDDTESKTPARSKKTRSTALEQKRQKTFVVSEVTIYDRQTQQQRVLSSAFTAPNRATLFMACLENMDLELLQQISCSDFARGTWNRVSPEQLPQLPLADVPRGEMKIRNSRVRGLHTELELEAESGQLLHVIMAEEAGYLRVEDVEYPGANLQVVSLRDQLEASVAMLELAAAWERGNLEEVQKNCSSDFARLVWSNVEEMPTEYHQIPTILRMPIEEVKASEKVAQVVLKTKGKTQTTVRMVSEDGFWLVDEMAIRNPDGSVVEVRASMRKEIAQAFLDNPAGTIAQTKHLVLTPEEANGVMHADGKMIGRPKANFTLPPSSAGTSSKGGHDSAGNAALRSGYIIEQHGDQVYYKGTKSKPADESTELVRPAQPVEGFPALKETLAPEKTVVPQDAAAEAPIRTSEVTDPSESPIDIE